MKLFISYTRSKDTFLKVSALRERIEAELAIRSPGSRVFQDKAHLKEGDHFPEVLASELSQADVLLILLSPAWLVSDWCRHEYSLFTQAGLNHERLRRILPVLWVDTPQLAVNSQDSLANALATINYADWRDLRYGNWDDPAVQRHVGKLAERALNMDARSPAAVTFAGDAIPLRVSDIAPAGSTKVPAGKAGHKFSATTNMPVGKRTVVSLKVDLVLNSREGRRRIVFGLEKGVDGDTVEWRVIFKLFERTSKLDEYGEALVTLDVYLESALNAMAESAANSGLTPAQAKHALGPAADDAKGTIHGEIEEEQAIETIQATLKKK